MISTILIESWDLYSISFLLIFLKERVEFNYAVGVMVLIASVVSVLYFTA